MGDQTVNWSERDGMRSALTGMLSGGMSGFALNHSDTGGYTTLIDPPVTLGRDVLVAPAFSPGAARTTLPLPAGHWQHVWSSRIYRGQRTVTVDSPLGKPAVFVRAGSKLTDTIRRAGK